MCFFHSIHVRTWSCNVQIVVLVHLFPLVSSRNYPFTKSHQIHQCVCVCISLFEQSLHCDLGIFEHKKSRRIFIHLTFFSHKFTTSPLTKSSIIISSSFSTNFADIRQAKSMGGIWLHCLGVKIYGDYLTVLQCFSPIFFVRQGLCGAVVINFVQKAP